MAQPKTDNTEEYVRLLDLLARVNDEVYVPPISNAGERERLIGALDLANKFISHALTILHLLDDTNVLVLPSSPFPPIRIIKTASASINVLTRATMEAFLVFHYVFYAPTTAEEKDYRYWAYKAAGLAERQNFPTITEEGRQTLDNDKVELGELCTKLNSNTIFQSLTDNQKKRILKGKGKLSSWREIAIDAGFSKVLARHMYSLLCGYAHSGSLSVLQAAQALINKETKQPIQGSIATMNIVIANMIREYCALFPRAQDVLNKDLEGRNLIKQYIQIGHELDKYMVYRSEND